MQKTKTQTPYLPTASSGELTPTSIRYNNFKRDSSLLNATFVFVTFYPVIHALDGGGGVDEFANFWGVFEEG